MAADAPIRRVPPSPALSRRRFLGLAGSALLASVAWRRALAAVTPEAVVTEPFAGIHPLAEGVWAIVSTPLETHDFTTVCNGGIVAGSDRVLVIEAFGSPEGAAWAAGQAQRLAGRRPTDVLVTHFHGDHTGGLAGFANEAGAPAGLATEETVRLTLESGAEGERLRLLEGATRLDAAEPTRLDLGGRQVVLTPRVGHTPSDVTVAVDGTPIVFCGDLVWNEFFPNYRDTLPSPFAASIRDLLAGSPTLWVPGHGPLADRAAVERLLAVVDALADHAVDAHRRGLDAAAAAESFHLPQVAADWTLFSPSYFEVAIGKVYAELDAAG
ncbi:MAG: MBL fold metallo-hydrolase [Thermoanaerobaculia bacterium]